MKKSKLHETKNKKTQKDDNFRSMKDKVKQIMNRQQPKFHSNDGKPLNYSFKKIRNLEQIITMLPKQGMRKQITVTLPEQLIKQENKQVIKDKQIDKQEEQKQQGGQDQPKKKVFKGPQIIRTISLAAPAIQASPQTHHKITTFKSIQKKKKERIQISCSCTALFLSYNKIQSIQTLPQIVKQIMIQPQKLMWLDISHNRLQSISCDLSFFKQLKTLYLHVNYLFDTSQILKLKLLPKLKILMIHANPIQKIPQLRSLIAGLLEKIVKIDSVLVSHKERQRAYYILDSLPLNKQKQIKLPKVPQVQPQPSSDQDDS